MRQHFIFMLSTVLFVGIAMTSVADNTADPGMKTGGRVFGAFVGGPKSPDGLEVNCDLPTSEHIKNTGGSDGAGLCVFASAHHAGCWHGIKAFYDIFNYMKRYPGGGYPEKFTRMIDQLCREKGYVRPEYIQLEGNDLEFLARAVNSGHLVCVTYCYSFTGRYQGQKIAHMVNCVGARLGPQKLWVILDNNFPGTYEWITEDQFRQAYTGMGGGWAIVLLCPGPPPVLRMP